MTNPFLGLPAHQIDAMIAEEKAKENENNPYIGLPKDQIDAMIAEEKGNKNSLAKSFAKELAMAAREGAGSVGDVVDFVTMLPNAALKGVGLPQIPSQGENIRKGIDYYSNDYAKPTTDPEKIRASIYGFAAPGVLNKVNAIGKGGSLLAKTTKEFLKPTVLGGAATGVSQHVLNKEPENYLGAVGAGLLTSTLGGIGKKGVKNVVDQTRIARVHNPNAQIKILDKISANQGLNPVHEAEIGKELIKSAEKQRNDYAKIFQHRYNKTDAYYNKLTKGNRNEKRFVDVDSTVGWIADEYKKLESPIAKQKFLSSKLGNKFKNLLQIHDVEDIDKLLNVYKHKFDVPKIPYHEARALQKDIMNDLSKSLEIGNIEKGQFKQVSKRLSDSIGSVFKDSPQMQKYWHKTNDMYSSFLDGDKNRINDILKHKPKPRHNNPGNPIEAYRNTAAKILTKEDPRDLDFILKGLNEQGKHKVSKGFYESLGTEKGKYNPLKGKESFAGLQPETRNPLFSNLSNKDRIKIESSNDLLDQFMHEKNQPHKTAHGVIPSLSKKILSVTGMKVPSLWTGDKSISKTIDALERRIPQTNMNKFVPKTVGKGLRTILEPLRNH